jgi:hypothetical protein
MSTDHMACEVELTDEFGEWNGYHFEALDEEGLKHQALLMFGGIRSCGGVDLVDGTEADGSGGGLLGNPPPLHVIGVPQQIQELRFSIEIARRSFLAELLKNSDRRRT